jgi:putative chitinase
MTQLTENFNLSEMTVSPTAKRLGLSNQPTPEHIENMRYCCEKILEPVRAKFGPVTINSSYRAPAVNKAVGGSKTSQHVNGQAIDFEVKGVDNKKVADWVADNLEFDQVILEFYSAGDKNSGWVHASIKKGGGNRKMRMIASKSKAGGTVYTTVKDFDPSTLPGQYRAAAQQASSQAVAPAQAAPKAVPVAVGLGPLAVLQSKCGVAADGKWGPSTYKAARNYFKLTNNQAAHFFGQCAHESGNFKVFSENLNYSADGLSKIFTKYFPTVAAATPYARKPEKIANKVYASRMGNGAEASGDGWKFRGRGPIQLTGKDNYTAFAAAVGRPDVLTNPDLVVGELAFESALWFFRKNNLLAVADKGVTDAIITQITKRVNGGTHGLDDRLKKTKQFANWG